MFLLMTTAVGVHIRDMDIHPDDEEIYKDDEFHVEVDFSGSPCNSKVLFFLDDIRFSSKNLRCDTDEIRSDEWNLDSRPVDCGIHEIRVELIQNKERIQNISQQIRIGRVPEIIINPGRPLLDREVTIKFTEDGDPVRNTIVKIYRVKDGISSAKEYDTDTVGEIEFMPDETGEYKLVIDDSSYCGSETFYAKKTLIVDGPDPPEPKVGDPVTFALSGAVGAKLVKSNGETVPLYTTISGGVNFTINEAGTYTLVFGELSTEYWGVNKTLVVSEKPEISIVIDPEKPVIGRAISVNTKSDGKALAGVNMEVEDQSGGIKSYTTDLNGVMNFIPGSIGLHRIYAEKEGYKDARIDFHVYNPLHAFFKPESPSPGQEVSIIVKDQLGYLISGVNVFIPEIPVGGKTDSNGIFKFNPQSAGRYTIDLNKENYWEVKKELIIYGVLELNLNRDVIEIGDSATILASDSKGNPVPVEIKVRKPDGSEEIPGEGIYTPNDVGKYQISASGEGYGTVSKELILNPHPLELNAVVEGDELVIKAESSGQPVSGITILLKTPTRDETFVTDDNGISRTGVEEGKIRIIANTINVKREYGFKDITSDIRKEHSYDVLAFALIVIVVLGVIAIFVSGSVSKGGKGSSDAGRKKSVLESKGKGESSLSRL